MKTTMFQFYYSAIKTNKRPPLFKFVSRFNSTIVRLRLITSLETIADNFVSILL